jgi:hypothetical protein
MNKALAIGLSLLTLTITSCSEPDSTEARHIEAEPITTDSSEVTPTAPLLIFRDAANYFAESAQAATKAMLATCASLQADIQTFLTTPTEAHQETARNSYIPCYQAWVGSSLYFQQPFGLGEKKTFDNLVDLIDTRPFLPGYIDGIPEYPFSGLIHEMDIQISTSTIRSQHRLMDEDSASVGFPVIEFFLWKAPVNTFWEASGAADSQTTVERRQEYLRVATNLLLENLTQAVMRWQPQSEYFQLPEGAQQALVLKSLQRITMVDLLAGFFEDQVIAEPEWHHPAIISGQGRDYITVQLKMIESFLGIEDENEFTRWLAKATDLPIQLTDLRAQISQALIAVEALPANYPAETEADEAWQTARQQLATVALSFSQLSEHFQVSIVTN